MDNLQVFTKDEFGTIRTVQMNGEIYFVGKDVATALGYSNTRDAIAKHVETEDKSDVAIHDGSQNRTMAAINESGLYALIFGSKLESAKRFKHWVTSEVLPSIRKHGIYATDNVIDEFGTIRTVQMNGEIYFVGKDVAIALGYAEPRSAVSKKVEEEDKGVAKIETPSGIQEMTVITESGLYALILGSKLESAKKFKHWITSEVLPTIRKTGGKSMDNLQVFTKDKTFTGQIAKADKIENICGVECYEENGTAYLKLESVARGLGFTDNKSGVEYVRWQRVDKYLEELNFSTSGERPEFIPENIFYRLAMKAKKPILIGPILDIQNM